MIRCHKVCIFWKETPMNGFGRIARKLILLIMTVVMLYLSFTSMFTTVYVTDAEHIFFCGDHTVYILLTIFALVILLVIFRIKKIGILKDQTLRAAVWMLFFLSEQMQNHKALHGQRYL